MASPTQEYLAPDGSDGADSSGSLLPDIDIRSDLQKVVTDKVDEVIRNAFMTANSSSGEVPALEPTPLTERPLTEVTVTLPERTSQTATTAPPAGQSVAPPAPHSDGQAVFGARIRPLGGGYLPPPGGQAAASASAAPQATDGVG